MKPEEEEYLMKARSPLLITKSVFIRIKNLRIYI